MCTICVASWPRRLFPRFVVADISSIGCERPGQDRWPSSAMVFFGDDTATTRWSGVLP
jgi:hypothetical protein